MRIIGKGLFQIDIYTRKGTISISKLVQLVKQNAIKLKVQGSRLGMTIEKKKTILEKSVSTENKII